MVERVTTYDRISRNRFVTRYVYHHGHYDGVEREFRGFGLVEQLDTESFAALTADGELPADNVDAASHVPPVLTKTWFHTGVYVGRDRVSDYFAGLGDAHGRGEYYRDPDSLHDDAAARLRLLDDTVLPEDAGGPPLTIDEEREACRALRGAMLRQEIYALDGTATPDYPHGHPYTVTEQSFGIEVVQRRGDNRHAVFFTHPRETITYHYEREPADPRIAHALTLAVDAYGNVLRSMTVAYPRAPVADRLPEQSETHLTLTLARFANVDDVPDWRRVGVPVETRTYEVVKPPATASRFGWRELHDLAAALAPLDAVAPPPTSTVPYEQWHWRRDWVPADEPGGLSPAGDVPHTRLRLVEHVRTLYRPDDLGAAAGDRLALLPLGTVQSLALAGESYKLAFTPTLLDAVYRRPLDALRPAGAPPPDALLPAPADVLAGGGGERGGYVDLDGDGAWWMPSGRVFFSPAPDDGPAQELDVARRSFFVPRRYRDPFHLESSPAGPFVTETVVDYDDYALLVVEARDALGSRLTVGERDAADALVAPGNDYRVLQPRLVTDANGNRTAVAIDALGMVVGTAVMGKTAPAPVEGDSLAGFDPDLTDAVALAHLADPTTDPLAILAHATTRLVYDLAAFERTQHEPRPQPAVVYTIARETHDSEPAPAGGPRLQHGFSYSDGFGREIARKIPAEPGPVPRRDGAGAIVIGAGGAPELTDAAATVRWVGSGWTIFDNKGKPVRQYEPFFSETHRFERDVRIGVSPVLFYDPAERVVATLHANHTWEKVVFGPWRHETWDVNDTVTLDPRLDDHVRGFFVDAETGASRLPATSYLPTWRALRTDPAHAAEASQRWPDEETRAAERRAAERTAVHAATPTIAHADTLGRSFLTVAQNALKYSDTPDDSAPVVESYRTRILFDVQGRERAIVDPDDRVVVRYDYDVAGNRIHQSSIDAGERWSLSDVAGKPLYAWDSLGRRFRTAYDRLRRPTSSLLKEGAADEQLVGRIAYGEEMPKAKDANLRGKIAKVFDQAGVAASEAYDFKGNLTRTSRQLARSYSTTLRWSETVPLEDDVLVGATRYDALNRRIELTAPDAPVGGGASGGGPSVVRLAYNAAGLLERVDATLAHQDVDPPVATPFVTDVEYDAKGQRVRIDYGNGVVTRYAYDPLTFRLVALRTERDRVAFPDDCPQPPLADWPGCQLQSLHYTYDPIGNVTAVRDDAQQKIFFRNARVEPSAEYVYDAVYRLLEASGREHLGQVGGAPIPHSYGDAPRVRLPWSANDGRAMGTYLERYRYDDAANLRSMEHHGTSPGNPGWTKTYTYDEDSRLEAGKHGNRLTTVTYGGTTESYSTAGDGYDAHGSMRRMPQLRVLERDFKDQLRMTQRQAVNADDAAGLASEGERTWYVYDSTGQRVRKVTELPNGNVKDERVYLAGFEIYRRHGSQPLVRQTLHVTDDKQRIALVETRVEGVEPDEPARLVRYQLGNHLGSAMLELDDRAQIVSYEEYTPFGSTSYQAVRRLTETPKRHRYTGKERDEESGLYYHGARYYAPWLARWVSCDPTGIADGLNLYVYGRDNPVRFTDPNGTDCSERDTSTCDYGKPAPNPPTTGKLLPPAEAKSGGPPLDPPRPEPKGRDRTVEQLVRDAFGALGDSSNNFRLRGGFLLPEYRAERYPVVGSDQIGPSLSRLATVTLAEHLQLKSDLIYFVTHHPREVGLVGGAVLLGSGAAAGANRWGGVSAIAGLLPSVVPEPTFSLRRVPILPLGLHLEQGAFQLRDSTTIGANDNGFGLFPTLQLRGNLHGLPLTVTGGVNARFLPDPRQFRVQESVGVDLNFFRINIGPYRASLGAEARFNFYQQIDTRPETRTTTLAPESSFTLRFRFTERPLARPSAPSLVDRP